MKANKYQKVIIASKYARTLNAQLREDKPRWKAEGAEHEKRETQPSSKIAGQALKSLQDGKIECDGCS